MKGSFELLKRERDAILKCLELLPEGSMAMAHLRIDLTRVETELEAFGDAEEYKEATDTAAEAEPAEATSGDEPEAPTDDQSTAADAFEDSGDEAIAVPVPVPEVPEQPEAEPWLEADVPAEPEAEAETDDLPSQEPGAGELENNEQPPVQQEAAPEEQTPETGARYDEPSKPFAPRIEQRRYPDGAVYEGEMSNNVLHGHGIMKWPDGAFYDGDWNNNVREGHGTFRWPDGSVYVGDWKGGGRNGHGRMTYSNGETYDGNWYKSQRAGFGKLRLPNGDVFEGPFFEDRMNGEHIRYCADGRRFRCIFQNGQCLNVVQIG